MYIVHHFKLHTLIYTKMGFVLQRVMMLRSYVSECVIVSLHLQFLGDMHSLISGHSEK